MFKEKNKQGRILFQIISVIFCLFDLNPQAVTPAYWMIWIIRAKWECDSKITKAILLLLWARGNKRLFETRMAFSILRSAICCSLSCFHGYTLLHWKIFLWIYFYNHIFYPIVKVYQRSNKGLKFYSFVRNFF